MFEDMIRPIKWVVIMLALVFAVWFFETQYQAVRKYYPGMSRWDYFILQDKLRITPEER